MALTVKDLEIVQSQLNQDYQLELVDGEIIIASLSGYEASEVASEFGRQLRDWVRPRKLGRVTGAGAGFVLSNSDICVLDVSFVRAERLRRSPETFAELAPDLIVEVKSPSDSVKKLRAKIDQFLEQGTRVGILIHPKQRWVEVRRSNAEPVTLKDGDVLTVPDLLPCWEVQISELWSPVFDD